MGWSPDQVDRCSLWQFQAAADGYRRAHQSDEEAARELSLDEVDELAAFVGA
ncbi:hypothetical protein [Aureimonas ureilytica]|uniref:hypothetical protein n=1 Tax=Aureimonas ureilytica TaxID=401562 RepID=UPI000AB84DF4|nr:hypothetical protein [Aureimonas ureilytica]